VTRKTHKETTDPADYLQVPANIKLCPECGGYGGGCTVCETCWGSGLVRAETEAHRESTQQSKEANRENPRGSPDRKEPKEYRDDRD
jgi:DnaJ-class molecular chaperone